MSVRSQALLGALACIALSGAGAFARETVKIAFIDPLSGGARIIAQGNGSSVATGSADLRSNASVRKEWLEV